jgi:D-glycero-D-manno-heptose 1,7-bisphosphate phosphatase
MNKVIFLDRDGTINIDEDGYISNPDDLQLYPKAGKAISYFNKNGFKVVLVTNQSGIARGFFTYEDLSKVHERLKNLLAKDHAYLDDILISPYHPKGVVEPYNIAHEDRKPGIGLLKKYYAKYNFKSSHSFMIGDKISDIELGHKFNLKTILVLSGEGKKTFLNRELYDVKPDFVVNDLWQATEIIEKLKK